MSLRGVPAYPGESYAIPVVGANGVVTFFPVPQNTNGQTLVLTDTDGLLAWLAVTGAVYTTASLPYGDWLVRRGVEDLFGECNGIPWSTMSVDTVTSLIRIAQFT